MNANIKRLLLIIILIILAIIPFFTPTYLAVFLILLFMYTILAESYDILGGYTGYINLGHSSFFGIGAYVFGILFSRNFSVPIAFINAILFTVIFAAIISYPFFRLRGAYFSLATFGLISLLNLLAFNLSGITGGSGGLSIPSGYRVISTYYASLILVILTIYTVYKISNSKLGLALIAIREDEETAEAFGINAFRYKFIAMIISSTFPAAMGSMYMWYSIFINPDSVLGLEIALVPVTMAMLGGSGVVIGPVIGAIFLTVIEEILWTKVAYLHLAAYGIALAIVGLFMPGGIAKTRWFKPLLMRLS